MSGRGLSLLILGGYGTFGGRLARLLADEPRLELIVAGRSAARAADFCAGLGGAAACRPEVFDRDGDVERCLAELRPDVLVDASGPFQAYGDDPYRVVRACLKLGVPYLDLADGSDFVAGVAGFDAEARAAGVAALSGVSTFPVLSCAAARRLADGIAQVDEIAGGIAPSPYAGVGLNVIRAIAGYAGRPVRLMRDGRWSRGHGLAEAMRFAIRPPGRLPLPSTLFSLVDVPDLQLTPALWPGVKSVWMGAGPRPEVLHRMLVGLAWLVRLRLMPSLTWMSPLFHAVSNTVRWGEHRGGMFVRVRGRLPDGRAVERTWHLLAEADDGPLIPSMAAEALVRRMLDGHVPPPGARPAAGDLELDDYEALFAGRAILTGRRETIEGEPRGPLYRRHLGDAWEDLPPAIRELHDIGDGLLAEGRAEVDRGRGLLARIAAAILGAPAAGRDVPVSVAFSRTPDGEVWRRTFAGRVMQSVQAEGRGRWEGLVRERFGPVTVGLACVLDGDRLRILVRRWSLLGLVLPLALAPRGEAFETGKGGIFRFHVEMRHPWTGLIVRYRGWLKPV